MDAATFKITKAKVLARIKARAPNTEYFKINNYRNKRRYKKVQHNFQGRRISERVQDIVERVD